MWVEVYVQDPCSSLLTDSSNILDSNTLTNIITPVMPVPPALDLLAQVNSIYRNCPNLFIEVKMADQSALDAELFGIVNNTDHLTQELNFLYQTND